MTATRPATIREWLRLAYQGGEECPPPEAYLPDELSALDGDSRRRLEAHAEACVACGAERELAAGFALPGDLGGDDRREVSVIARRLARRAPHSGSGGWWSRLPSWGSLMRTPAFQLAAAAVLVLGVGVVLRDSGPPPLGDAPADSVMRSSALLVEAPVGDLEELPAALSWQSVEGAERYEVSVLAVDETLIFTAETPDSSVPLDAELASLLRPAVSYTWQVEAYDASGARIAWSPATEFRLAPSAADESR